MQRTLRLAARTRDRVRFMFWRRYVRLIGRSNGVKVIIRSRSVPKGTPRLTFSRPEAGGRLEIDLGDQITFERGFRIDAQGGRHASWQVGDRCRFGEGARINLYGASVSFGDDCEMRTASVIHAYGRLEMGDEVMISFGAIIHCGTSVTFGNRVGIAERVSVFDSDHTLDGSDVDAYRDAPVIPGSVVLGDNVLVFANSLVMRGVTLNKNSAVAGASVVRAGTYPESSLLAGVPAKVIKDLRPSSLGPSPTGSSLGSSNV